MLLRVANECGQRIDHRGHGGAQRKDKGLMVSSVLPLCPSVSSVVKILSLMSHSIANRYKDTRTMSRLKISVTKR